MKTYYIKKVKGAEDWVEIKAKGYESGMIVHGSRLMEELERVKEINEEECEFVIL